MNRFSFLRNAGVLGVLTYVPIAQAEYIVVKTKPCSNGQNCVSLVNEEDPSWSKVFDILDRFQWPTALLYNYEPYNNERLKHQTEYEVITHALCDLHSRESKEIYEAVFVPNTLYELFVASFILKQGSYFPKEYSTLEEKYGEYPENMQVLAGLIKGRVLPSVDGAERVQGYFRDINRSTWQTSGKVNSALFAAVMELAKELGECPEGQDSKKNLDEFIHKNSAALRAKFAILYNQERNKNRILIQSLQSLELPAAELDSKQETLLDRAIAAEFAAQKLNQAVLFRGTNGYTPTNSNVDRVLDKSTFRPTPGETDTASLSFGCSVVAGLVADSSGDTSACAYAYLKRFSFGYTLSLDKREFYSNGLSLKSIFEISPLGAIGRPFGRGEFFHARSKVGTGNVDLQRNTKLRGVNSLFSIRIKEAENCKYLVEPDSSEEEISQKIDGYIADHAQIFSFGGKLVKSEEDLELSRHILSNQKLLSKTRK